jgi:hypothetical protein
LTFLLASYSLPPSLESPFSSAHLLTFTTSFLSPLPSVISSSLLSLLRELETTIDPALSPLLRSPPPWDGIENVSGPSKYVYELVKGIYAIGDVVREGVDSRKWIRSFCDKAVGIAMAKMTQAVVKSRPLKKVGAEQVSEHYPWRRHNEANLTPARPFGLSPFFSSFSTSRRSRSACSICLSFLERTRGVSSFVPLGHLRSDFQADFRAPCPP